MTPADRAGPKPARGDHHWSAVFESDDVERSRAHVAALLSHHALEHHAGDRSPVFRHRHGHCGALGFNELTYTMHGGDARIEVPELPGMYLFELNLFGHSRLRCADEVLPFSAGQLCVINAAARHHKRWITDGRQIIVKLSQGLVQDALEAMIERPVSAPVRFDPVPRPIDAWTASLANLVKLVCSDLDKGGAGLVSGRAAHSAERLFVELLIETIPNNYSHLIEAPQTPKPAYLRNAVDFIHARAGDEIGLDDIVAAAGVSPRSLYEGFRRHYASPPMAYLRAVRLDMARDALRSASGSASVTEAALACGFNHLSKFAKAYRDRFGEKPSETLARRA